MNIVTFLREKYEDSKDALRKAAPHGVYLSSGRGRDELTHHQVIIETLALADKECPQAADTIRVLLWRKCLSDMNSMQVAEQALENPGNDVEWALRHLEQDADLCSQINGSDDAATVNARRLETTFKRLAREVGFDTL